MTQVIVTNSHTFTYKGVEYVGALTRGATPDVIDVDDDDIRHLWEHGVRFETVDADGEPVELDALALAVGDELAGLLRAGGLLTPDAVRAASDDQLRAVRGIGEGRFARIREALPAGTPEVVIP